MLMCIFKEPPIDSASTSGEKPQTLEGNIVMRNLYFNYPSRPDVKVFITILLFFLIYEKTPHR